MGITITGGVLNRKVIWFVFALAFAVGWATGWLLHKVVLSGSRPDDVLRALTELGKVIAWPLVALVALAFAKPYLERWIRNLQSIKVWQFEAVVRTPASVTSKDSLQPELSADRKNRDISPCDPLPLDYLSLAHTAYYSPQKQQLPNFRPKAAAAGYDLPVFDFRVWLVSYYPGALDTVYRVEYYIGEVWDKPIQNAFDRKTNFELHELVWGEILILAKVYFKDNERAPVVLNRWINIPSGKLDKLLAIFDDLGPEGHRVLHDVAASSAARVEQWTSTSLKRNG